MDGGIAPTTSFDYWLRLLVVDYADYYSRSVAGAVVLYYRITAVTRYHGNVSTYQRINAATLYRAKAYAAGDIMQAGYIENTPKFSPYAVLRRYPIQVYPKN